MIVLAIDTAGTGCFAGVYDAGEDRLLASAGADIGRGHAEQLMAFVDQALADSGCTLADIDRIAVTIGPGSFTGIRVGVAAARGRGARRAEEAGALRCFRERRVERHGEQRRSHSSSGGRVGREGRHRHQFGTADFAATEIFTSAGGRETGLVDCFRGRKANGLGKTVRVPECGRNFQ